MAVHEPVHLQGDICAVFPEQHDRLGRMKHTARRQQMFQKCVVHADGNARRVHRRTLHALPVVPRIDEIEGEISPHAGGAAEHQKRIDRMRG